MTAKELLTKRDRDFAGEPQLFFNNALGLPYEDVKATMPIELLRQRCMAAISPGLAPGVHVLGADQGSYALIARSLFPPTPARELGTWAVVHVEYVKDADAYSTASHDDLGQPQIQKGRLAELMAQYEVRVACIDAQPDLSNARSLQRDCPFRVFAVHSSGMQKAMFTLSDSERAEEWPMATESTHASFDRLFRAIREKELLFHRMAEIGAPPYPEDVPLTTCFQHLNNIAKVLRSETKAGRQVQATMTYVPRGPARTHPVHYATAATKLLHAMRMYHDGAGYALSGVVAPSAGLLTFSAKEG
jgi:hypothetical protein